MVQSKLDKRLEDIDHNLLDLSRHLVAASSLTEERLTTMATVLDKILMRLEQGNEKATGAAFFDIATDDVADCTRADYCVQCWAELPTTLKVAEAHVNSILSELQSRPYLSDVPDGAHSLCSPRKEELLEETAETSVRKSCTGDSASSSDQDVARELFSEVDDTPLPPRGPAFHTPLETILEHNEAADLA